MPLALAGNFLSVATGGSSILYLCYDVHRGRSLLDFRLSPLSEAEFILMSEMPFGAATYIFDPPGLACLSVLSTRAAVVQLFTSA